MGSLSGKRILLIGGAGFIGHHLALVMKQQGAIVEIIDGLTVNNLMSVARRGDDTPNRELYMRLIDQRLEALHQADIPLHVMDAREYHALCQQINGMKPDVVLHLAAIAHANVANKNPFNTFDHSLRTLENALDACRSQGVERFVFFSSSMVYGNFVHGIVDEDTPCDPLGIYGALKFSGEKMVIAYNQVFDLPYTIIRPSALYGERCVSRRVGQVFIENALLGRPIEVFGRGDERLDFTYIQDMVQGVIKAIESPAGANQIFNITCGNGRALNEMLDIVKAQIPNVEIVFKPRDRLMPERGTLSIDKARRLIGYEPAYQLERGYVDYINWYKSIIG